MCSKTKNFLFAALIFIAIAMVSACPSSNAVDREPTVSVPNKESSPEPTASPTPVSFFVTQLLTYAKANETELAKTLTDKEIFISGDVWSAVNSGGGTASFEFWSLAGRISCSANNIDAAKLNLLEKSVSDYLNKRANKMPFVKAKGIYKKAFPPSAPPNDFWRIVLENCSILEVTP